MEKNNNSVDLSIYESKNSSLWNNFISESKNGTFLFLRSYMDYHSDRFSDHSLLFFHNDKLAGVLPANLTDKVLYSHAGLTYGGVVADFDMKISLMLEIFDKLVTHCKQEGFEKIIYKAIPYIYHSVPAEEDLYALFRHDARLIARSIASSIYLPTKRRFVTKRREAITKAKKNNVVVERSYDFDSFMNILEEILKEKHEARPVHSLNEIKLLASRFPDNIKLFGAFQQGKMLASCLVYESQNVAHGQYAANSIEGRTLGAQDVIIDYLINEYYKDKKFFDFGTSTEKFGTILNEGLAAHKESFRASAIVYDTYEIPILR